MSTTREMVGLQDLTGQQIGTLRVGQMVSRRPQPRYQVACSCGCVTTESHERIVSGAARCRSSNHNRITKRRERLEESEAQIAQRQAELAAAQKKASAARMEYEADGYTPPLSFAEQQARLLRERRDREEQERIKAEQRAADATRHEAERQAADERKKQEATQRERNENQRRYWAQWVQESADPRLVVSDAMRSASMPKAEAEAYTAEQAAKFAASSEYGPYRSLETADAILSYLRRNGVFIADVETIRTAFIRLRDLGLLKAKLAPAPQPKTAQPRQVNLTIEPAKVPAKPEPVMFDGWDEDGNPRQYSEREVARWSADEMKRRLRLTAASGALALPNVGPGPRGYAG